MSWGSWKPTRFIRFIRTTGTSTNPALVLTDAGEGYLKALNNPMGPHALAKELVGTLLAEWLGLTTLDSAIMRLTAVDEVPLTNSLAAAPGPAFITRRIENATQWGGDPETLDSLDNPSAITGLVVLDTWRKRPDNVLFSPEGVAPGRLRLVAMDHTECFHGRGQLDRFVGRLADIRDERVFGLFPEFEPRIDFAEARSMAARLAAIELKSVQLIVDNVPAEWQVSAGARSALCEFIHQRAMFVAETIVTKLGESCGELPL